MTNREALIALNMLPKIGPVRVQRLLEALGSAEAILTSPANKLTQVRGIGNETAQIIRSWETSINLAAEIQEAERRGIQIITQEDDDYPAPLRQMYDPPLALYVWGELKDQDKHAMAVVGSRRCTHYGQSSALSLSRDLAASGLTIISGLARGIDTFGHRGALEAGGRTVAVIGSGLAQLYPPENMRLAEEIADGHGAVVSEFPLQQPPDKKTFPMRNRIVASWASGVLVVECPQWSGSLITANLAADMGKNIYAVPGPIDRPTSAGCNQLIRDGATLVTSAQDILDDLETLPLMQSASDPANTPAPVLELDELESSVISVLSKEELLLDQLVASTGLSVQQLSATLLKLEMKSLVRQLPGPRYILR
ncbi:hypothetical protein Rhal01_01013 [Rubritalea halochordaticola]|uniref:DNA-protecting protein DprA n=1 Tax=Rubritalea halochordaticola TaxID=714537 RepID=A0ABP9UWK6_9BACT